MGATETNEGQTQGAAPEGTGGNKVTTYSQEEVNAMVREAVKKEAGKYAGFADLKKKAEEYDRMEEANKSELQKAQDKAAELQKKLDAMAAEEEARGIREKVAKATGVPESLLTGTTEEDCKAQAAALLAFKGAEAPAYPNVLDGGEPQGGAPKKSAADEFTEWFNNTIG